MFRNHKMGILFDKKITNWFDNYDKDLIRIKLHIF